MPIKLHKIPIATGLMVRCQDVAALILTGKTVGCSIFLAFKFKLINIIFKFILFSN
jgi:hypothetical protein